jgi:hypothetical protein
MRRGLPRHRTDRKHPAVRRSPDSAFLMTRDQYLRQAASLRPLVARSGVIGDDAAHTDDV